MVRAVKGKPGTQKRDPKKDEFSLATLQEIKRDKHRDCETRRRQQETAAVNMLKEFIIRTKKFAYGHNEKLDRMALLSNASMFISDHATALNVMVGVLCDFVASSSEVQDQIIRLSEENPKPCLSKIMQCFDTSPQGMDVNFTANPQPGSVNSFLPSTYTRL